MEDYREVNAVFTKKRQYFQNRIGREFDFTSFTGPYEYLLGALAGCWTYTLFGALSESTTFTDIKVNVKGKKRDEVPTVLEETVLTVLVTGCSDEDDFRRAAARADKDCSIYDTIAKVSRMSTDLVFSD